MIDPSARINVQPMASALPAEEHNWAPDHVGRPCEATVVHFRGHRKKWMAEWARRHMGLE